MHLLKKNRSFALLFFGSLVSEIGNILYGFAIALYILSVTGSASSMAIFMSVSTAVRVLSSPLAGVIVDKVDRIKIIYMTDYIRAALFLSAGILMAGNWSSTNIIIMLYVMSILSSFNGSFFGTAVTASVPEIVGLENLQAANSAQSVVGSFQVIIGVLLGAIVYSIFGLMWVLIINAFTFLFSAISEMFIKTPYKEEAQSTSIHHEDDKSFKAGVKYLLSKKEIPILLLFILFINFAITPLFNVGIPYYFNTLMEREPIELALVDVVFAVAMLIAGVVIGAIKIKSSNKIIKISMSCLTVLFVIVALLIYIQQKGVLSYWPFFGLLLFTNGLMGITIIFVNVPVNTGLVKAVDASYRGRVFSILGAVSQIAVPFAQIIGGLIIDSYGIVMLGLFCSVMVLIPSVSFVFNKSLTKLFDHLDQIGTKAQEETKPIHTEIISSES